nr:hypothetical protein CFP56_59156 [Quercus suber]
MLNGTSTLKAKYEVTIILDALDYANVQRIDPNRLHIRRRKKLLLDKSDMPFSDDRVHLWKALKYHLALKVFLYVWMGI